MNQDYENYSYRTLCELRDNLDKSKYPEEYSKLVEVIYSRRDEKNEDYKENTIEQRISTKPNLMKRAISGLIDYSIIMGYFFYMIYLFGVPNDDGGQTITGLPAFSCMLVWFLFTIIPEQIFGTTLGNYILKLRAVSLIKNKKELKFSQSFRRHMVDLLDMWPFGIIGILTIKNSEKNQRFGDVIAKTVVIDLNDSEQYVK